MNIMGHATIGVVFLAGGQIGAAIGSVAPDIAWVANEFRFRKSGIEKWDDWIITIPSKWITPYRISHSLGVPLVLLLLNQYGLALGWIIHILIDLFTHSGKMAQMPFFPISWRWKWALKK